MHKLRFAFLILILITGLGSMYSFYLMQRSKDYLQWREQVVSILMHLQEARIHEKNFILFGRMDTDFLANGSSALLINHQEEVSSIVRYIAILYNKPVVAKLSFIPNSLLCGEGWVNTTNNFRN